MGLDIALFQDARGQQAVVSGEFFEHAGVTIVLPRAKARGRWRQHDWQRKVVEDLLPDSVDADAPERTPASILSQFTSSQKTPRGLEEVLAEFPPLEPLFLAETHRRRGKLPIGFHVLAVKGAPKGSLDTKGFTYRTFALLCRDESGLLDETLVASVIEQFRRHPEKLDLAQRTVLERLFPGWEPDQEPQFNPTAIGGGRAPLDPAAGELFREDLQTLLGAGLTPADFFQYLNQLLILHLGLYLPRVAAFLCPRMDALAQACRGDVQAAWASLKELDRQTQGRHPFAGSLPFRAPDAGAMRPMTLDEPARRAYHAQVDNLSRLHFDLLMLVRVRGLASAYLAHQWGHGEAYAKVDVPEGLAADLAEQVRSPRELIERMTYDDEFSQFLNDGLTLLAARYVETQIGESGRAAAAAAVERASCGYDAMRNLYERYNRQGAKASNTRAYRQGQQVVSQLLRQGEYGLAQSRQGVGGWFEIGAGMLPLLVLLCVGIRDHKVPVTRFFARLEDYGISLAPEERRRVLDRLRAMGVYERYSDAGDAAFVRNLLALRRQR